MASGYPQNSVSVNFTHTHNFLLEVWGALYRHCLSLCLIKNMGRSQRCNWISSLPPPADDLSAHRNLNEMFADLSEKYNYQESFEKFMTENMKKNMKISNFGGNLFCMIVMPMFAHK